MEPTQVLLVITTVYGIKVHPETGALMLETESNNVELKPRGDVVPPTPAERRRQVAQKNL